MCFFTASFSVKKTPQELYAPLDAKLAGIQYNIVILRVRPAAGGVGVKIFGAFIIVALADRFYLAFGNSVILHDPLFFCRHCLPG